MSPNDIGSADAKALCACTTAAFQTLRTLNPGMCPRLWPKQHEYGQNLQPTNPHLQCQHDLADPMQGGKAAHGSEFAERSADVAETSEAGSLASNDVSTVIMAITNPSASLRRRPRAPRSWR